MNNRKQNILSNFDALSAEKKQFVMLAMDCILKSDAKPLEMMRETFAGNADVTAMIDETIAHIVAKATPAPRYILEAPNQIWYVTDYDGKYPVYLTNDYPRRDPHVFTDLATAKDALKCFRAMRGGAKLKIYQLADDGKRVEVAA
jgi:hypothetical protein